MPAICLDERLDDDMEDILPEDDEGELIPRHTAPDRIKSGRDEQLYDDINAKLKDKKLRML